MKSLFQVVKDRSTSAAFSTSPSLQFQGVKFLHDNGVMHRDLKPCNILLSSEAELKICDFGLSRRGVVRASRWDAVVLRRGVKAYSEAVDMWGVGCIMAEMLLRSGHWLQEIGRIVEDAKGGEEAYDHLRRNFFPATVVTEAGFDMLSKLLSWDPSKRITAECALSHVWFEEEESS